MKLLRTDGTLIIEKDAEIIRELVEMALVDGANLYDANLRRANLSGANLYDANLRRANLSGANLSDADLRRANLRGADLSGAYLYDANLRRANLSGANLSGANLSDADLRRANLSGANLSDADLRGANLSDAKNVIQWQSPHGIKRFCYSVKHKDCVMHQIGCFWGDTEEAVKAIQAKYGKNSMYERIMRLNAEAMEGVE